MFQDFLRKNDLAGLRGATRKVEGRINGEYAPSRTNLPFAREKVKRNYPDDSPFFRWEDLPLWQNDPVLIDLTPHHKIGTELCDYRT